MDAMRSLLPRWYRNRPIWVRLTASSSLDLDHNQLRRVPDCLGRCTQLKV